MTMFDSLWVEKYRPQSLDEIVLEGHVKDTFESMTSKEEIPNLLFIGNAGIGKTSLAKIIATTRY